MNINSLPANSHRGRLVAARESRWSKHYKHYNIGTIARTMAWAAHTPIILLMNMSGLEKSFLYILVLAAEYVGQYHTWRYVITFYLHGTKWINLFNIECTASLHHVCFSISFPTKLWQYNVHMNEVMN